MNLRQIHIFMPLYQVDSELGLADVSCFVVPAFALVKQVKLVG